MPNLTQEIVKAIKEQAWEHYLHPEVEDHKRGSVVYIYDRLPLTADQLARGETRELIFRIPVLKPPDPEVETEGG